MVVVVVSSTTVATPLIQFSGQECVRSAIVLDRVEDRHTVGGQSDRTTKEMRLRRHRILCRNRIQRNTPRIVASVRLRQRDLLLPCRDAGHHGMVRHAVGFNEQVVTVKTDLDFIFERIKQRRKFRPIGLGRRPTLYDRIVLRRFRVQPNNLQLCLT